MNLEFSRQIFEKKNSNIKFHKYPSNESRVDLIRTDPDRWMDRHDKANSRFSQICERA